MGGAIGGLTSMMKAIAPIASMIPGLGAAMTALQGITQAADKLQDAAKSANPADKMKIDDKLSGLKAQATQQLTQAQGLAQNAAAAGVPQAANISKMLSDAQGMFGAPAAAGGNDGPK